jgi:hypothetical protein
LAFTPPGAPATAITGPAGGRELAGVAGGRGLADLAAGLELAGVAGGCVLAAEMAWLDAGGVLCPTAMVAQTAKPTTTATAVSAAIRALSRMTPPLARGETTIDR